MPSSVTLNCQVTKFVKKIIVQIVPLEKYCPKVSIMSKLSKIDKLSKLLKLVKSVKNCQKIQNRPNWENG